MRWEGGQGLADKGDETFGFHPSEMANCLIQTPHTLCLLHTDTQEAGSCWRPFQSLPSKSHGKPHLHTHRLPCSDTSQSKLLGACLRLHLLPIYTGSYVFPAGPATSFASPRWDCQIKWVNLEFQIYHEYFLMEVCPRYCMGPTWASLPATLQRKQVSASPYYTLHSCVLTHSDSLRLSPGSNALLPTQFFVPCIPLLLSASSTSGLPEAYFSPAVQHAPVFPSLLNLPWILPYYYPSLRVQIL